MSSEKVIHLSPKLRRKVVSVLGFGLCRNYCLILTWKTLLAKKKKKKKLELPMMKKQEERIRRTAKQFYTQNKNISFLGIERTPEKVARLKISEKKISGYSSVCQSWVTSTEKNSVRYTTGNWN